MLIHSAAKKNLTGERKRNLPTLANIDSNFAPVTKRKSRRETHASIKPATHFFHGKYLLNYLLHQTLLICWENKFRILLRPLQNRKKSKE